MAMLGLLSAYAQLDAQAEESGEYYSTLMGQGGDESHASLSTILETTEPVDVTVASGAAPRPASAAPAPVAVAGQGNASLHGTVSDISAILSDGGSEGEVEEGQEEDVFTIKDSTSPMASVARARGPAPTAVFTAWRRVCEQSVWMRRGGPTVAALRRAWLSAGIASACPWATHLLLLSWRHACTPRDRTMHAEALMRASQSDSHTLSLASTGPAPVRADANANALADAFVCWRQHVIAAQATKQQNITAVVVMRHVWQAFVSLIASRRVGLAETRGKKARVMAHIKRSVPVKEGVSVPQRPPVNAHPAAYTHPLFLSAPAPAPPPAQAQAPPDDPPPPPPLRPQSQPPFLAAYTLPPSLPAHTPLEGAGEASAGVMLGRRGPVRALPYAAMRPHDIAAIGAATQASVLQAAQRVSLRQSALRALGEERPGQSLSHTVPVQAAHTAQAHTRPLAHTQPLRPAQAQARPLTPSQPRRQAQARVVSVSPPHSYSGRTSSRRQGFPTPTTAGRPPPPHTPAPKLSSSFRYSASRGPPSYITSTHPVFSASVTCRRRSSSVSVGSGTVSDVVGAADAAMTHSALGGMGDAEVAAAIARGREGLKDRAAVLKTATPGRMRRRAASSAVSMTATSTPSPLPIPRPVSQPQDKPSARQLSHTQPAPHTPSLSHTQPAAHTPSLPHTQPAPHTQRKPLSPQQRPAPSPEPLPKPAVQQRAQEPLSPPRPRTASHSSAGTQTLCDTPALSPALVSSVGVGGGGDGARARTHIARQQGEERRGMGGWGQAVTAPPPPPPPPLASRRRASSASLSLTDLEWEEPRARPLPSHTTLSSESTPKRYATPSRVPSAALLGVGEGEGRKGWSWEEGGGGEGWSGSGSGVMGSYIDAVLGWWPS